MSFTIEAYEPLFDFDTTEVVANGLYLDPIAQRFIRECAGGKPPSKAFIECAEVNGYLLARGVKNHVLGLIEACSPVACARACTVENNIPEADAKAFQTDEGVEVMVQAGREGRVNLRDSERNCVATMRDAFRALRLGYPTLAKAAAEKYPDAPTTQFLNWWIAGAHGPVPERLSEEYSIRAALRCRAQGRPYSLDAVETPWGAYHCLLFGLAGTPGDQATTVARTVDMWQKVYRSPVWTAKLCHKLGYDIVTTQKRLSFANRDSSEYLILNQWAAEFVLERLKVISA